MIIFIIFFRIVPAGLISSINGKADDSCGVFQDIKINNYMYSQSGDIFSLIKCLFDDTTSASEENTYIIHSNNVNLNVESCQFNNCILTGSVIQCDSKSLIMYSNSIYNCLNHNNFNSKIIIVKALSSRTDIRINNITFLNSNHNCRAYFIQTFANTIFQNNRIEKAYQSQGSWLYINISGTCTPLDISGCLFSGCAGGNGAVLFISSAIQFFQIFNTTFECFTNLIFDKNGKGCGYFIEMNAASTDFSVLFEGCLFSNIESNAIGGGSIGLWTKNIKNEAYSVSFIKCEFEDLFF